MKNGRRDYSAEKNWEKGTNRASERAQRMRARRKMEKAGAVSSGDGKHVDHVNGLKAGNGRKNLRVTSARTNLKKEARSKQRKS